MFGAFLLNMHPDNMESKQTYGFGYGAQAPHFSSVIKRHACPQLKNNDSIVL